MPALFIVLEQSSDTIKRAMECALVRKENLKKVLTFL